MTKASRVPLCAAIMIVLIAFSIGWGAQKGWKSERAQVDAAYESYDSALSARVEVCYNLLTVAQRHLSAQDALVSAVDVDRSDMESGRSASQKAVASERLTADADALLKALADKESVKSDSRDLMYVTQLLPQALEQSADRAERSAYATAAEDFNRRYNNSFSGMIARLTGMNAAEEIGN